jgi:hypothetical protein
VVDRKTGEGDPGPIVGVIAAAKCSDIRELGDDRCSEQRMGGEAGRDRHWREPAGASPDHEGELAPEPPRGAEAEPTKRGRLLDGWSHLATT